MKTDRFLKLYIAFTLSAAVFLLVFAGAEMGSQWNFASYWTGNYGFLDSSGNPMFVGRQSDKAFHAKGQLTVDGPLIANAAMEATTSVSTPLVKATTQLEAANITGTGGSGTLPILTGQGTANVNIASGSAIIYTDGNQSTVQLYGGTTYMLLSTNDSTKTSKYTQIGKTGILSLTTGGVVKARPIQYDTENDVLGFNTTTNSAIFIYAIMPATPTNGFQLVGGSTSSHYPFLIQSATSQNRLYLRGDGLFWGSGTCSFVIFEDRTPGTQDDVSVRAQVRAWKLVGESLDHTSLGDAGGVRQVTDTFVEVRRKSDGAVIAKVPGMIQRIPVDIMEEVPEKTFLLKGEAIRPGDIIDVEAGTLTRPKHSIKTGQRETFKEKLIERLGLQVSPGSVEVVQVEEVRQEPYRNMSQFLSDVARMVQINDERLSALEVGK